MYDVCIVFMCTAFPLMSHIVPQLISRLCMFRSPDANLMSCGECVLSHQRTLLHDLTAMQQHILCTHDMIEGEQMLDVLRHIGAAYNQEHTNPTEGLHLLSNLQFAITGKQRNHSHSVRTSAFGRFEQITHARCQRHNTGPPTTKRHDISLYKQVRREQYKTAVLILWYLVSRLSTQTEFVVSTYLQTIGLFEGTPPATNAILEFPWIAWTHEVVSQIAIEELHEFRSYALFAMCWNDCVSGTIGSDTVRAVWKHIRCDMDMLLSFAKNHGVHALLLILVQRHQLVLPIKETRMLQQCIDFTHQLALHMPVQGSKLMLLVHSFICFYMQFIGDESVNLTECLRGMTNHHCIPCWFHTWWERLCTQPCMRYIVFDVGMRLHALRVTHIAWCQSKQMFICLLHCKTPVATEVVSVPMVTIVMSAQMDITNWKRFPVKWDASFPQRVDMPGDPCDVNQNLKCMRLT